LVLREWNFGEPAVQVFSSELIDLGMTINFDKVSRLEYVDAIEHVEEILPLKWYESFSSFKLSNTSDDFSSGAAMAKSSTYHLNTIRWPAMTPE
jgi:hypothetical protein